MQEIEQLIDEMEQLLKKQEELTYISLEKASISIRRLGIICLLCVFIEILMCIIISRISAVVIASMVICGGTAIYNFYKSSKLSKQAQKYKKE